MKTSTCRGRDRRRRTRSVAEDANTCAVRLSSAGRARATVATRTAQRPLSTFFERDVSVVVSLLVSVQSIGNSKSDFRRAGPDSGRGAGRRAPGRRSVSGSGSCSIGWTRAIRGGRSEALMIITILVFPGLSVRRTSLAVARSSRGIGISVQSRLVGLVP